MLGKDLFIKQPFPVAGAATGIVLPLFQANAFMSFLLAAVSKVTEAVRARLEAVSCYRMVVSFEATSTRFLRAAPMLSMVGAAARITVWVLLRGLPPPKAWSWHWRLRWARWNATFQACHIQDVDGRPSQLSTSMGNVGLQGQPPMPS